MGTHHTLINGTSYAITGGTDLVNGTKYQIGGGRTLVNGTVYNIAFAKPCMITISGGVIDTFNSGYLTYKGQKYTSGVLEINQGESVSVYVQNGVGYGYSAIQLNGKTVAEGYSGRKTEYTYQISKNANVTFTFSQVDGQYAKITEQ